VFVKALEKWIELAQNVAARHIEHPPPPKAVHMSRGEAAVDNMHPDAAAAAQTQTQAPKLLRIPSIKSPTNTLEPLEGTLQPATPVRPPPILLTAGGGGANGAVCRTEAPLPRPIVHPFAVGLNVLHCGTIVHLGCLMYIGPMLAEQVRVKKILKQVTITITKKTQHKTDNPKLDP
jgi:hypothetical protein